MTDQNTRPQPSAEPVAWMYEHPAFGRGYYAERQELKRLGNDTTETPLYPASALEAARREALERLPDEIDIYRAMKSAPSRKLIDLARAVAALLPKENTNG